MVCTTIASPKTSNKKSTVEQNKSKLKASLGCSFSIVNIDHFESTGKIGICNVIQMQYKKNGCLQTSSL